MIRSPGIYGDLSNEEYHKVLGPEEAYYSSSQLKDMLDDPEVFYKKYIAMEAKERKEIPAFAIGTTFHTAILEPEKMEKECTVWEGGARRGKAWDAFKQEHKGKAIITMKEQDQVKNLVDATKASPVAMDLLREGIAEQSLFVEMMGVRVKVRFDWKNDDLEYILDLKSTTGSVKNEFAIRNKVSSFQYEMSAALYMDAMNEWFRQNKIRKKIKRFYWTFASKDLGTCKTWMASPKSIEVGRAKYQKALRLIKQYTENGWKFEDEIGMARPNPWEVTDWLDEKKEQPRQAKNRPTAKIKQKEDWEML